MKMQQTSVGLSR